MNMSSHALFDPKSAYNVLRASLLAPEKIRGYFYWRQTRRARGEEQPGPSAERPPLVLRAGAPCVPLPANVTIPRTEPLPDRYTVEVTLHEPADLPQGAACRAFLVEQAVLDRLRSRAAPAVLCREGKSLTVRDPATWQVRAGLAIDRGALFAAVLDEKSVVVLSLSGKLQSWDTVSGKAAPLAAPRGEKAPRVLAVTAKGGIAWGNAAGEVIALDPATGETHVVQQHESLVTAVAALPDGRLVSGHHDGVVCVERSTCSVARSGEILAVAAAAQGQAAFLTAGGTVGLWTPGEKKTKSLTRSVSGLAGLPDGRLVTAGSSGLVLWDVETGTKRTLSAAPVRAVVAAPGPRLIKMIDDRSVWVWNLQTGQDRLLQPEQAKTGFPEPLAAGTLRPFLADKDEQALGQLLDHRLLGEELAVQQAVSALPELEGQLAGDRIVLEAAIPPGCPNISDRAWVVVVVDAPAPQRRSSRP